LAGTLGCPGQRPGEAAAPLAGVRDHYVESDEGVEVVCFNRPSIFDLLNEHDHAQSIFVQIMPVAAGLGE